MGQEQWGPTRLVGMEAICRRREGLGKGRVGWGGGIKEGYWDESHMCEKELKRKGEVQSTKRGLPCEVQDVGTIGFIHYL